MHLPPLNFSCFADVAGNRAATKHPRSNQPHSSAICGGADVFAPTDPETMQIFSSTPLPLPFIASPQTPSADTTTDRIALLALYGLTGGATWNNNDNWDTDADLSLWHGVEVNAQGRVVTLKLPYNNLQGTAVHSPPDGAFRRSALSLHLDCA